MLYTPWQIVKGKATKGEASITTFQVVLPKWYHLSRYHRKPLRCFDQNFREKSQLPNFDLVDNFNHSGLSAQIL